MADDRVTIGGALGYALTLWTQNWRAIWPALALNSLAASAAFTGDIGHNRLLSAGSSVVMIVTQIIVYGAVFRLALGAGHEADAAYRQAPSGIQWRSIEWRMLAANLLVGVFFLIVIALCAVALGSLVVGLASSRGVALTQQTPPEVLQAALGPAVSAILFTAMLVAGAGLLYAWVRLILALPATADRNRISVLSTWKLTRGQFWRIFLSMLAISVPIIFSASLIAGVLIVATGGSEISAPAGGALAAAVVMGVALGAVATPLTAGMLAYFYRLLRDRP
jgi:hypothetical protein